MSLPILMVGPGGRDLWGWRTDFRPADYRMAPNTL